MAKVTSSSASDYAEYLDAKTQQPELGDYYLKDGERTEVPGRWVGGAERFGLAAGAPVAGEQLRTLMDVRRPDTGQPLRRAGGTGEAVSAIDATFSAPKSVSAVWALGGPALRDEIEQAHERAVDRAMTYATAQVPMLRRRVAQDTVVHEKASRVVATSWRHTTARAVGQQVPDPQLHSHVLLHAAVRRDGELVAIDSRSWLVHRREVGAAYRSELAREMSQLGFGVVRGTGRGNRYFELAEIPQPLIDRWSSRHHQVQAAIQGRLRDQRRALEQTIELGEIAATDAQRQLDILEQTGQLSPKQERMAATASRSTKTPVTTHDLDEEWTRTGRVNGLSGERIAVLRHHPHPELTATTPDGLLRGLTEFDATFPARDARAVALEQSAGAPVADSLRQLEQLQAQDEILVLADGTGTTRAHRGQERTVVAITQRLAHRPAPAVPADLARRETTRLNEILSESGGRLSDEQQAAIELGCGPHALVLIEGQAGTGKSTTLAGIARAHQANGQRIIVTSTAALAAERLATDLAEHDVTAEAYSTAALGAAVQTESLILSPTTTVIHDEAVLASTREQLQLLSAVEHSGARLIEVGDPRQNQPVGAGGLWGQLEDETHQAGTHLQLTANQRALDPADRRDQALFRDGHGERSLRGYAARDHLHLHDDPRRAEDHALDAAQTDRTNGLSTTVITQTSNDHLDALNARAQAIRVQAGQLGNDSIPVAGRPYDLHQGDDIQVRRSTELPEHEILRNGTTARIARVDPDTGAVTLQFGDDRQLDLTAEQASAADLRLAYVQHPFPAQGITVQTTHFIAGQNTTHEGTYVGLSRARDRTDIYASTNPSEPEHDRITTLADQLSRSEPELPSITTPLADDRARKRDLTTGRPIHVVDREASPERGAGLPDRDAPERPVKAPLESGHGAEEPSTGRRWLAVEPREDTLRRDDRRERGRTYEM